MYSCFYVMHFIADRCTLAITGTGEYETDGLCEYASDSSSCAYCCDIRAEYVDDGRTIPFVTSSGHSYNICYCCAALKEVGNGQKEKRLKTFFKPQPVFD